MKRSTSFTNIMPPICNQVAINTGAGTSAKEENLAATGGVAASRDSASGLNYRLTKAEKKQIKRDLLESAKSLQGLNKESKLRKNLIETEEDLEAKICEGS